MNLKVNLCCCYFTLQTGVKILSIFHLISAIVMLIGSAVAVKNAALLHSELHKIHTVIGIDLSSDSSVIAGELGVSVTGLVFSIFLIIVIGLAIDSAWKNHRPKFLIPWLVVTAIGIFGSIVIFIYTLVKGNPIDSIGYIISPVFEVYFWIVIYSFYRELLEK